ncbi:MULTISPECIES: 2OG-Fe(II) oxygenase [unclassified Sphingobacterium]|uniref:2OG-Fe(II) oxygenase n=1 Tax=unclassified Sphingobacterium TaxID=2609468 RepID=UPI0025D1787D|nr:MULTISPECIES: 2OG-Fe(II) oxygenase [unclassified Sphingobacterium]
MKETGELNWNHITSELHDKGYAVLSEVLTDQECEELKANYYHPDAYRKTVVMERYRFGKGEYKYFDYPLPDLIAKIRKTVYPYLATVANAWNRALHIEVEFPAEHEVLMKQCHDLQQTKATVLILKYGPGGFNTLHQDLYGEVYFPMQILLFLSEPEVDFTGGEFVLLQQIPRAQSQAIVLKPKKGDILIFTTNFRPVKGTRGYYRANMKHGVSEVHSGERYTLGIIFHDALS